MSGFYCKLELKGLPRLQGKLHWRRVTKERKTWREATRWAIRAIDWRFPPVPLSRATLTFTRYSSREPDGDNLQASFKSCRDALIGVLIQDDTPAVIGQPVYRWLPAKATEGRITIEVRAAR